MARKHAGMILTIGNEKMLLAAQDVEHVGPLVQVILRSVGLKYTFGDKDHTYEADTEAPKVLIESFDLEHINMKELKAPEIPVIQEVGETEPKPIN